MSRLAQQTSPYLLQHAGNPVDWYPWGEAAFAEGRQSGRPILLSIGYSACHWCHVMAHESFEDPATAELMNRLFVNVKVDREERPDVDRVYQLAHQLLTRRGGGWPLTMFLCHDDQRPFFGGTYFPPGPRGGMPAFRAVLERVAQVYQEQGPALREQSALLVETLARIEQPQERWSGALDDSPLTALRAELAQRFDRDWGGFSPAPKFPHAPMIARLLRDWRATATEPEPDLQALFMATFTLKRMIEGGLFDQLGGGFARYSVDERWEIPHFEKMLYDNGQLLSVLAEATQATGDSDFARALTATADCVLRDFRLPGGSFAAAFDADSEGREGAFYLWTPEQVRSVLDEGDAALFEARFGLDGDPNFEHGWIPVVRRGLGDLAADPRFGSEDGQLARRLDEACARLLAQRSRRPWPARDDKRLTGWVALAIRGLADAARALGREDWAQAASDAVDDLRARHWREERLVTASRGEQPAHIAATLDDHAFLLDALLQLCTVRFRSADLRFAIDVAEALLERFEDREHGAFWFTAHDDEQLIHRSRVFADDATPAGNAVAAGALLRLGALLAEPRYLLAAERTLRSARALLVDQPLGTVQMANSLDEWLHPPAIVVLRGEPDSIALWRRELQRAFDPRVAVFAIPAHETDLPEALSAKRPAATTTAWVCRGTHCEAPLTDLAALRTALT